MTAQLHLAVDALALQLLLERAQRLLDIIVANDDLHRLPSLSFVVAAWGRNTLTKSAALLHFIATRHRPPEHGCGGAEPLAGPRARFKALQMRERCGELSPYGDERRNLNVWVIGH